MGPVGDFLGYDHAGIDWIQFVDVPSLTTEPLLLKERPTIALHTREPTLARLDGLDVGLFWICSNLGWIPCKEI